MAIKKMLKKDFGSVRVGEPSVSVSKVGTITINKTASKILGMEKVTEKVGVFFDDVKLEYLIGKLPDDAKDFWLARNKSSSGKDYTGYIFNASALTKEIIEKTKVDLPINSRVNKKSFAFSLSKKSIDLDGLKLFVLK